MSTLYLVDAHNSTVADSRITDILPPSDSLITGVSLNGNFPVFIPSSISLSQVGTVDDLNTAKYSELLALYPGFTYISYEDYLSAPSVNTANSTNFQIGDRVTTSLNYYGILETNPVALSSTPNTAILTWEVYEIVETISDNRVLLILNEIDPDTLTVQASFDGGSNFQSYLNGVLGIIPVVEQGSSFVVKFTNGTANSYHLASWSVLY